MNSTIVNREASTGERQIQLAVRKRKPGWRKERKDKLRAVLFMRLGTVCVHCGTISNLTFDLVIPSLDDKHHRMNAYDRVLFYIKEYEKNNLQVLCDTCNGRKGLAERYGV